MIQDRWRYFAPDGSITPGGPSTWNIVDFEQRRTISVTMDSEQDTDDLAIRCLSKHIQSIPPGVYRIHVSPSGDVLSSSPDPEDDETACPHYPPLRDPTPPGRPDDYPFRVT